MKLSDLKAKATASELTLILAVEAAVRGDILDDINKSIRRDLVDYVKRNPLREDRYRLNWAKGLEAALEKLTFNPES